MFTTKTVTSQIKSEFAFGYKSLVFDPSKLHPQALLTIIDIKKTMQSTTRVVWEHNKKKTQQLKSYLIDSVKHPISDVN